MSKVAVRIFRHPLEFNLIGAVWNLRVGVAQIALWRNYKPIFDLRPRFSRRRIERGMPQDTRDTREGVLLYGWFDDPWQRDPSHDPSHDAPCLFCGRPINALDVRTHSLMSAEAVYAKRSYFYRTHKSCAERDTTGVAIDGFILDMIQRNGD